MNPSRVQSRAQRTDGDHISFHAEHLPCKVHHMFFSVMPLHIEAEGLILRIARLSDCYSFSAVFDQRPHTDERSFYNFFFKSPLFTWWWLRKTFSVVYCIEYDLKLIGFIGLYELQLRKSAHLSLFLFDENFRRRGLGTRAFTSFKNAVQCYSIAEELKVAVKRDHYESLSFWSKMGFQELHSDNSVRVLTINVKG